MCLSNSDTVTEESEMKCILLSGLPASGKSTVAKHLSEMFGFPILSKDRLNEILFDNIGFDCYESKRKLDRAGTYTIYYIPDNYFEKNSGKEIEDLLEKYGYSVVTVMLKGDTDTFIERFNRRNQSSERHRGHAVSTRFPEGNVKEKTAVATRESFRVYEERGMGSFCIGKNISDDTTDLESIDCTKLFTDINILPERSDS